MNDDVEEWLETIARDDRRDEMRERQKEEMPFCQTVVVLPATFPIWMALQECLSDRGS